MPAPLNSSYLPTSSPTLPCVFEEKSIEIDESSSATLPSMLHTSSRPGVPEHDLPPFGRLSTPFTYAVGFRDLRPSGPTLAPTTLTLRRQPGCFGSSYSPVKTDPSPVCAFTACAAPGSDAS